MFLLYHLVLGVPSGGGDYPQQNHGRSRLLGLVVFSGIINNMKIFVGTDHAGFTLKEKLIASLKVQGYDVVDKGAYEYNESDDYPDFITPVAREVSKDPEAVRGIILGATGQGEAMDANKFPHVRAMVYYGEAKCIVDDESNVIVRAREHNDSNILSLGARYLTEETMLSAVNLWLETPYSKEERHVRRLEKIDNIKLND